MSRPFDWLYEALAGYNHSVVSSALAQYRAQLDPAEGGQGNPYRTPEQWIRGVRQILSAPDEYSPAETAEHWLRQRHYKAVVIARQWEDNAEGWRLYAEHLQDCIHQWAERVEAQQRVTDSLLDYIADLPLPKNKS